MTLIRAYRIYLNRTQNEFAQMISTPLSTYQKWEQGQHKPPKLVIRYIENTYHLRPELVADWLSLPSAPRAKSLM